MRSLEGRVALVAGATRGAGRGIAIALGEAGATVLCTGRSTRGKERGPAGGAFDLEGRPETIEETAEAVTAAGGVGVPLVVDHADDDQVRALAARVSAERGGLDILVNDIWGGESLTEFGVPFWDLDLEKGFQMVDRAIGTHIRTARYLGPLLIARGKGLIVEVTDGDALYYRGTLFYDFVKTGAIRLAFAMAEELRPHGVAAVAITPGFLRSEAMLAHFGVTEERWRDGIETDAYFAHSETPRFVGRAIAALAAAPDLLARSGRAYSSWGLAREFGFTDTDGRCPDWGAATGGEAFAADQAASHARFVASFRG